MLRPHLPQPHIILPHHVTLAHLLLGTTRQEVGAAATRIHLSHDKEVRHLYGREASHLSRLPRSPCGRRLLEGSVILGEDIATGLRHRLGLDVAGRMAAFWVWQAHRALRLGRDRVWALTTDGYTREEGSVQGAGCPKFSPRFSSQVFSMRYPVRIL